jgi:hypothetical protein
VTRKLTAEELCWQPVAPMANATTARSDALRALPLSQLDHTLMDGFSFPAFLFL